MDPQTIIQKMNALSDDYNKEASNLGFFLHGYLTDKNVPIHERWQVFLNAPDDLMCESPFIIDMPDVIKYIWGQRWCDVHKHQSVHLERFLYDIIDEQGNIGEKFTKFSTEDIHSALEELMYNGVNRFIFDF